MKKKMKVVASTALFLCFWSFVFYTASCLVAPKYQSGVVEGAMISEYYREGLAHDVLMVGDCELYENISTVKLFEEYGITSYIRGSAQQLTWQSYYLLEDTLRYETPKVVVFNVLALKYNEPQKASYNRMTIEGMRWSKSKIGAIKASMTKEEQFTDYLFPLLSYHDRWSSLTKDDFKHLFYKDLVTHNGYYMRVDEKPAMDFPDPMPLSDYTLGANAMSYLDKMTALCKEKGIELLLVKAPIEYPHWYTQWDEQIVKYAKDHDVDYINFIPLQDEIGLDMSKDTYDGGLHLNLSGAEKMATYFGGLLKERYDLSDYRENPEYSAQWAKKTERYNAQRDKQYEELEKNGAITSFLPVETKETNVMKNFAVFALVAALCLTLIACNGKTTTKADVPSNPESEQGSGAASKGESKEEASKPADENPVGPKGYAILVGETAIAVGGKMAPVAAALGEPTKYFEAPSCAFQGMDKTYTYGGVVIRTTPDEKGEDVIQSMELKDDMTSTAEGVCIGDTKEKVVSVYGAAEGDGALVYPKDGMVLTFFLTNGEVTAITYMDGSLVNN